MQLRFTMEITSSGDVPFVPKSVPLSRSRCQIWCQDGQDNIKSNTEKSAVSCYGALFSCVDNGENQCLYELQRFDICVGSKTATRRRWWLHETL